MVAKYLETHNFCVDSEDKLNPNYSGYNGKLRKTLLVAKINDTRDNYSPGFIRIFPAKN